MGAVDDFVVAMQQCYCKAEEFWTEYQIRAVKLAPKPHLLKYLNEHVGGWQNQLQHTSTPMEQREAMERIRSDFNNLRTVAFNLTRLSACPREDMQVLDKLINDMPPLIASLQSSIEKLGAELGRLTQTAMGAATGHRSPGSPAAGVGSRISIGDAAGTSGMVMLLAGNAARMRAATATRAPAHRTELTAASIGGRVRGPERVQQFIDSMKEFRSPAKEFEKEFQEAIAATGSEIVDKPPEYSDAEIDQETDELKKLKILMTSEYGSQSVDTQNTLISMKKIRAIFQKYITTAKAAALNVVWKGGDAWRWRSKLNNIIETLSAVIPKLTKPLEALCASLRARVSSLKVQVSQS